METGTLSRSKAVQGGVRADEVVEEDEHGNEVVGRRKGREALFGFVPGLELFVEALNEVVGNVIVETLYADVLYPMERLNRHLIGKVAVAHNGARRAKILYRLQYGESLRTVSVTVEMEAEDKACLTVQNEPEVVFLPCILTTVSSACHSSELKLSAGMSCMDMFWNKGAKLVHQLLMVV